MRKLLAALALLLLSPCLVAAQTPVSRVLTSSADGTSSTLYSTIVPQGATSAVISFRWVAGGNPPTNCDNSSPPTIWVIGRTSPTATITIAGGIPDAEAVLLAEQLINCNESANFEVQQVQVASYPVTEMMVAYVPGGTTSGTYELVIIFSPDRESLHSFRYAWPTRSTTGTWTSPAGLAVGPFGINNHVIEVEVTGAPATCTLQMQGSNGDLLNFSDSPHFWSSIGTAITCTTNITTTILNAPTGMIRPNLTALTGGTSPTVKVWYVGTR